MPEALLKCMMQDPFNASVVQCLYQSNYVPVRNSVQYLQRIVCWRNAAVGSYLLASIGGKPRSHQTMKTETTRFIRRPMRGSVKLCDRRCLRRLQAPKATSSWLVAVSLAAMGGAQPRTSISWGAQRSNSNNMICHGLDSPAAVHPCRPQLHPSVASVGIAPTAPQQSNCLLPRLRAAWPQTL